MKKNVLRKPKEPGNTEEQDYLKPDPEEIKRAKEVILILGKTCSFMKVYPPENPSVKNLIDSFTQKIIEFLNQYGEIKIQITEFSFSFGGETIYKDDAKKQSLPFLFFKDGMLSINRGSSNTKELQTLLLEILFLEEKEDQFSGTLDVLDQCHQEVVYKADFAQAVSLLNHVLELKETVSDQTKEKEELLEKILSKAKDENSLKILKKIFLDERIQDFDSFFQYLKILGPTTLSLAADIWEKTQDPILRSKVSSFLQEMGQQDFESLLGITQDGRVDLTKEVIAILGRTDNKEIIPHLKKFTDHKDKNIRLATIQALKIINDEAANEILLRLLKDENGEVRTLALMNLNHLKT